MFFFSFISTVFLTSSSSTLPRLIGTVSGIFPPKISDTSVPSAVLQRLTSYALEAVMRPYLNKIHTVMFTYANYFGAPGSQIAAETRLSFDTFLLTTFSSQYITTTPH